MIFYTNVYLQNKSLYCRGYRDGKQFSGVVPYKPTIYKPTNKNTKHKTENGQSLEEIRCSSIKHAQREVYNSQVKLYGNKKFVYQFINKAFPTDIKYDTSLIKILTIDIETTTTFGFPDVESHVEDVLLITVQDFVTKKITSFGCKPFSNVQDNVTYVKCDDERHLLRQFVNFIKDYQPDIITGWNCRLFDITYLSKRIKKILGDAALRECCPSGDYDEGEITFSRGRKAPFVDWRGVSVLDYMDVYKKFAYKTLESYALDFVAKEELGDEKVKHGYDSFKDFYTNDWQLFTEYNIKDVELVTRLEDKMKLLNLIITMAYEAKCNYLDLFSPVRVWDCVIYSHLLKQNIHPMVEPTPPADREIIGAFVKDPVPAKHEWVVSFDATSLYPTIMMTFNMSKDTLVEGEKYLKDDEDSILQLVNQSVNQSVIEKINNEDLTMVANGQCFRKDKKGTLPQLIEMYFDKRIKVKKEMIDAQKEGDTERIASLNSQQMAAKILMNSLYGASGNIHFRWHDKRIAEGITMTGQYVIRYVAKRLNEYLNKICKTKDVDYSFYSDTDSTYITLGTFVKQNFADKSKKEISQLLDKFCETALSKVIDKALEDIFKYNNVFQKKLSFKREVIADSGVWLAKKRYALNVYDSEGVIYEKPKLKVQGMEIVRSSTPASVRSTLKESVGIVLTKDEETLRNYVKEIEDKWHKLEPPDIAFPRTVNNVSEYRDSSSIFRKGTPIHVKGALMYNHLLTTKNLKQKYQEIYDSDKIKFVYLKKQNPLGINVITFRSEIPPEFRLNDYVDYDMMFEKAYLEPLQSLLNVVGWSVKEQATLEGLFG